MSQWRVGGTRGLGLLSWDTAPAPDSWQHTVPEAGGCRAVFPGDQRELSAPSMVPRGKEKGASLSATHPAAQVLDLPYCYHDLMRKALADSTCR